MPSGKTHNIINSILLPPAAYYATTLPDVKLEWIIAGSIGFVFATFLFSPDLDTEYSGPSQRWKLLSVFWRPYRRLFPHRSLSHSVVFGSFTRIIYLSLLCSFGLFSYSFLTQITGDAPLNRAVASATSMSVSWFVHSWHAFMSQWNLVVSFVGGIWVSDLIHLLADRLNTARKYVFRI
ncbi:metal-binding protein [Bdellovibrionota bacterium FG-2]